MKTSCPAPASAGLMALHERVELLLDRGECLAAYEHFVPLLNDGSPEALLAASSVMRHTGADRPGYAKTMRVWRENPEHDLARLAVLRYLVYRTGPYRGWAWLERLR